MSPTPHISLLLALKDLLHASQGIGYTQTSFWDSLSTRACSSREALVSFASQPEGTLARRGTSLYQSSEYADHLDQKWTEALLFCRTTKISNFLLCFCCKSLRKYIQMWRISHPTRAASLFLKGSLEWGKNAGLAPQWPNRISQTHRFP